MLDLIDKSGEVTVRSGPDGGVQGGAKGGPPIASPPCAEAEWGGLAAEALAAARRDGGQGAVGGGAGPGAQGGRCPRPGADPDEAGGEAAGSWAWGGHGEASSPPWASFSPCFHHRWTNCACCSWRRWMRTRSSRTSTWSRYWELRGVPAAPIPSPPPYTCPLIPPRLISLPFNASSQIQGLELRLQQSQKLLKAYEETQEKMKKVS